MELKLQCGLSPVDNVLLGTQPLHSGTIVDVRD